MEFAELIKTPKLDRVVLSRPFKDPVEGAVCITGHHLIFSSRRTSGDELWLLHRMIDGIERKPSYNGGVIILKGKDFRIISLEIMGYDEFMAAAETLESLASVDQVSLLYPFFYRAMYDIIEDGWEAFQIQNEFTKIQSDEWRISHVNKNFALCKTYPESVIVPRFVEDDVIKNISSFRCLNRFPVLSYYHKATRAVIVRAGQPMVGPSSKRCKEDEKMINMMLGSGKRGYIIDTRAQNLAQLAKTKGGGYEPEAHYPLWRRVHKSINRHTTLLESLYRLMEGCNDTNSSMDKWLSRLESCGWLSQVQAVLGTACLVAQCINEESASVLIHGAESRDSTLQVCSLAQVILDPDCRTVHGFEALIEREWLQAGHPFGTRCKNGAYTSSSQKTRDQSPIFLLFIDCVYQILTQFPYSFEFNEDFLIFLVKHSYASQFGTFLSDSIKERNDLEIPIKTVSLWSYINRPVILQEYLNPTYEPNSNVIWPSVAPQSIVFWESLYMRWTIDQKARIEMREAVAHLKSYESELKSKAAKLRKQLLDLTIINESKVG